MKIALSQISMVANMEDNFSKALECMVEAKEQEASLIIFPELLIFLKYFARER